MKKKLIHILYSGLGGTTDYVFNLIKADVDLEYEHVILFYGIENVPVPQWELANTLATTVKYIKKAQGYDKKAFKSVRQFCINQSPQFITLHVNSLILTCSKLKHTKLIFVEHQANHLKTKKEWLWSALAQLKANNIVCLTPEYQTQLKSKLRVFYKLQKNKIITTGIDLSLYASVNNQTELLKIGMLSRINKFRDHKTLISAFEQLNCSNIELHIAGDGALFNELKLSTKNSNIKFHGNISQLLIPKFLSELDVYCQASFGETSSIALMQAQASALPIIATNVKGINNVLTAEHCFFVEPKSVQGYKTAIEFLINDTDKRNQLAKKSLAYAQQNLSHFRMFTDYKKLLK